jgi:hypothetical protein
MLTNQEKLALAITSYGSQRALARALGVTHQKVGRWLKEGLPGGVKAIPAPYTDPIDRVFANHVGAAAAQARADRIPFDPENPVFFKRGDPLRNGDESKIFFAQNTEYIRPEARRRIYRNVIATKKILKASVGSKIDVLKAVSQSGLASMRDKYDQRLGRMKSPEILPVFTKGIDVRGGAVRMVDQIEKYIAEKHAPSAKDVGTEFLFQLTTVPGKRGKPKPKRSENKRRR